MSLVTALSVFCAATTFAAGLVVVQRRLVTSVARRFVRLPRLQQVLLVLAVGVMTVCAQKSGTNGVSGAAGNVSNAENGVVNAEEEETQGRGEEANQNGRAESMTPPGSEEEISSVGRVIDATLPQAIASSASSPTSNLRAKNSLATNVFAITSFSLDCASNAVSFTVAWASNLFDSVDSRNVDLYSSTNLLERRWTALGARAMPSGTNVCAFVVTSNDVRAAARPRFLDTFAGLGFFRFGLDLDSDGDGLTDAYESFVTLTDPTQPDTDGDGMNDGWECRFGFSPLVDNDTDDVSSNDIGADPDGDGLTNGEECTWGTNPSAEDSDGDGVNDGAEVAQNSDPNDASDEGRANSRVPVRFTFGDPSSSQSEKYRLSVSPVSGAGATPSSFAFLNEVYGECETKTAMLKAGWRYEVRLSHAGTDPDYDSSPRPDYDYKLVFGGALPANVILGDPSSLFGTNYASRTFAGAGKVATLYVLADPQLAADINHDGQIDETDEDLMSQGRRLRFWTNDDGDRSSSDGDMARDIADEFPVDGLDWDSGRVNGRRDLIDYTPVWINLKPVVDSVSSDIGASLVYRLRHPDGAVNAVWSTMGKSALTSFFKIDLSGFGPSLNEESRSATKVRVESAGVEIPEEFAALAKTGGNGGVVWIDGRQATNEPLWLEVLHGSQVVCSNRLDLSLSTVEEMYRWLNLRGVCAAAVGRASSLGAPQNFPDQESNGGQFVFVHGYNVDETSARAWSAEMFKRLWQSGSCNMFTAVTWYGNDSQSAIYLGNTPDYYSNVEHALSTAEAFQQSVSALPGASRFVAAHSLGNMLVSSAIAEHGLAVSRYFMLNAAVPMEAYAPGEVTETMRSNMTPADWRQYALRLRANHWYELFGSDDARRDLTWKGRFASIANAVNYYSVGEDVLNNSDGEEHMLLSSNYAWANQEIRKGVWPSYLPGNNEAGWSFNAAYEDDDSVTPASLATLPDSTLKMIPVFGEFDDMSICTTNRISNIQSKSQLLADAIPAESYAAGRNPIQKFDNVEMDGMKTGGGDRKWTHSFILEAPYAWTFEVFLSFQTGEQ